MTMPATQVQDCCAAAPVAVGAVAVQPAQPGPDGGLMLHPYLAALTGLVLLAGLIATRRLTHSPHTHLPGAAVGDRGGGVARKIGARLRAQHQEPRHFVEIGLGAQRSRLVRRLPRRVDVVAAEVPVGRRRPVDRSAQAPVPADLLYAYRRLRPGPAQGFSETGYARLLDAAHQELGGPIVLIWDNLPTHLSRKMQSARRAGICRRVMTRYSGIRWLFPRLIRL